MLRAEREARELEEEAAQERALDLAREQWVLDVIAATAVNQAKSWGDAPPRFGRTATH
jgi:hypothetical protein